MTSILHLYSQRPGRTGSGVTLEALVRGAGRAGLDQQAVCGVPADDPPIEIAMLPPHRVHALRFGTPELPFPVPGMSDVMPYESTVFSSLDDAQWTLYREAWRAHLARVVDHAKPDLIHAHHVWVLASLAKEVAPDVPLVVHAHATGLRQLELCPDRAPEVRRGVRLADRFCVLHAEQQARLASVLDVEASRVVRVGAGYRDDVYTPGDAEPRPGVIAYMGKLAAAKGIGPLLDAFERLRAANPALELHLMGAGAGEEGEALAARARRLPGVTVHGFVGLDEAVRVLREASVFCLPSFYEGLPLVLVEAAACRCRLVTTRLPGVESELAPHLHSVLERVSLPRLQGPDRPVAQDLPGFVDDLTAALRRALAEPPPPISAEELAPFTWDAVFARVERVWRELLGR